MGRDVAGLRIDKKPNVKSNGVVLERVHVAPKISNEKVVPQEQEVEDHSAKRTFNEDSQEKQDVLSVKSINTEVVVPEGKTKAEALKPTEKKLSSPVKPAPEKVAMESLQINPSTLQSPKLSTERHDSGVSNASGVEVIDASSATVSPSSKTSDLHTPLTGKEQQPPLPIMSRKPLQPDSNKKHHDEDDNYSLASSAAMSVRTLRSKVTVPLAPTFKSAERAQRRKEFYTKLEEKHKALEAEKLEYASRTKEEEEAAIKQLRKTMVYRANPVPNFYREGPPPKVELKKLPVTRAKSPNLSRRKSCSDAVKSSPDEKKACARGTRHSIGVYKDGSASPTTPKSRDLLGTRNVTGPSKFKDSNTTTKIKARPKQVKGNANVPHSELEQLSTDIRVVAETRTSHKPEQSADIALVEEEMKSTVIEDATKTPTTVTELSTADVAVQ